MDSTKCTVKEGVDSQSHTERYVPATKKDHEKHDDAHAGNPPLEEPHASAHTHRYVPVTKKDHDKHLQVEHVKEPPYDPRIYPLGKRGGV